MQMLDQLKGLDLDRMDLDEAVMLLGVAGQMKSTYETLTGEAPEWLGEAWELLQKEVRARRRDFLEKRLKEIQLRRESLKTAEEKRKDLTVEEERIKAALGQT